MQLPVQEIIFFRYKISRAQRKIHYEKHDESRLDDDPKRNLK